MGWVLCPWAQGEVEVGIAHLDFRALHFPEMVLGVWDVPIPTETPTPRADSSSHRDSRSRIQKMNRIIISAGWGMEYGIFVDTKGEIPISRIPVEPPEGLILSTVLLSAPPSAPQQLPLPSPVRDIENVLCKQTMRQFISPFPGMTFSFSPSYLWPSSKGSSVLLESWIFCDSSVAAPQINVLWEWEDRNNEVLADLFVAVNICSQFRLFFLVFFSVSCLWIVHNHLWVCCNNHFFYGCVTEKMGGNISWLHTIHDWIICCFPILVWGNHLIPRVLFLLLVYLI